MYTNKDSSNFDFNLYSRTVPRFGIKGGSKCLRKCTEKCAKNCDRYCQLASEDTIEHTNFIKKLEEERDRLRTTVKNLPYRNTRRDRDDRRDDRRTPVNHNYYIGYKGSSRRRPRTRRKRGGLGFFGSTTDFKPCETDCKSNCSIGCTTLCDRAVKHTISKKDKEKIDAIRSEIELLTQIIKAQNSKTQNKH
jgi:hypothetical protein